MSFGDPHKASHLINNMLFGKGKVLVPFLAHIWVIPVQMLH